MQKYTIAIDGPAASGKSSTAEDVAKRLGFDRLDSGLLYRAITYLLTQDSQILEMQNIKTINQVESLQLEFKDRHIMHSGVDITPYLRTPDVDKLVGTVAKELYVRNKVHDIQREAINVVNAGIVVDGRDIGTVVLPDAFLKVFITAKDVTRAQRRARESSNNFEEILKDIRQRDKHDITREHGPLKCADDAILIENDEMTREEVVEKILKIFEERKEKV